MGYLKGFTVTFKTLFDKRLTTEYPKDKIPKPERLHGREELRFLRYEQHRDAEQGHHEAQCAVHGVRAQHDAECSHEDDRRGDDEDGSIHQLSPPSSPGDCAGSGGRTP